MKKYLLFLTTFLFSHYLNFAQIITTVAGNGVLNDTGNNIPATNAAVLYPSDVAADTHGNFYVAEPYNGCIHKVDAAGIITVFAGRQGMYDFGGDNGPAIHAEFRGPETIKIGPHNALYITDVGNNRIRKVDSNGIITTIAGNGTAGFSGDNGPATAAAFYEPMGIGIDFAGNIYTCDLLNCRIRKIDINGIVTTVAGTGVYGYGMDNTPATASGLAYCSDVVADSAGNLYIADSCRLRMVSTSGIITTIAGGTGPGYGGDGGPATAARFNNLNFMDIDKYGNVYAADFSNNRIRKIGTDGIITTVAGNGQPGDSGDNGPATDARLAGPYGAAVDNAGNIYIADRFNNRVRMVRADVGVPDVQQAIQPLRIYPNPANDLLYVDLPGTQSVSISIIDISGREVAKYASQHQQVATIALGHLQQGMYMCVVETNGRSASGKFIIAR